MNELATPALLCLFGIVFVGGLVYLFAGPVLARWIYGRVPGGRK